MGFDYPVAHSMDRGSYQEHEIQGRPQTLPQNFMEVTHLVPIGEELDLCKLWSSSGCAFSTWKVSLPLGLGSREVLTDHAKRFSTGPMSPSPYASLAYQVLEGIRSGKDSCSPSATFHG